MVKRNMRFSIRSGSASTGGGPRSFFAGMNPIGLQMARHMIVLAVGLAITMPAISAYSLLDEYYARGALLLTYLFAGLLIALSYAPRISARGGIWMRRIALGLSLSLVTLGTLLLMNGGLDRLPAHDVKSNVLEKRITGGRARQRHIFISSWRPGVSREDLLVRSPVYERAVVGKTVTVKVHPGYLGWPWYTDVSSEEDA